MGTIYFVDGRKVNLSVKDTRNFMTRLREGGVRFTLTRDHEPQLALIISNCPVAFVELDASLQTGMGYSEEVVEVTETAPVRQEDATKETSQEREKRVLAELLEKSNCAHEPEKIIYFKVTGKTGTRYFPKCSFCGWRGKFVAAESLSEEVREAAQLYQED